MAQQTAVEWLIHIVNNKIAPDYIPRSIVEEARRMAKEQIIKSNRDGVDMVVNKQPFVTGEEYYNKTYIE